ncbi:MAG: DUF58 domain-containing protein [uncultured Thiotrichaceae bacterium]|uniref:DUF58 domain-containing protein n=1 Tax=uncultured Thiotrichaceae bacterium TaxID=298394 RepID=A0A6S6SQ38_9GAMM|nr:MAG: DUF58 domain-containing protein [uncultured Thiotrichaceae bacterium]
MLSALSANWKSTRDRWLKQRFPNDSSITLGLNKIFVLPTSSSLALAVAALVIFLMAVNFQNALVYGLSFWLFALLVVNILFTYRNLSGLTIKTVGSSPCFAGDKAAFEIEVECPVNHAVSGVVFGWKHEDAAEVNLRKQETVRFKISHSTQQRGRFIPKRLEIFTRFPTGLIVAWSYASLNMESIVYPKPVLQEMIGQSGNADDMADDGKEIARGSTDFSGIRSYETGDSPKHIHWGTYAKTGELHTKSFVDYASQDLWLDWDALNIHGIENKLSHLCARVLQCHLEQVSYGLKIPGKTIPTAQGEAHKNACLTALAFYGEDS